MTAELRLLARERKRSDAPIDGRSISAARHLDTRDCDDQPRCGGFDACLLPAAVTLSIGTTVSLHPVDTRSTRHTHCSHDGIVSFHCEVAHHAPTSIRYLLPDDDCCCSRSRRVCGAYSCRST